MKVFFSYFFFIRYFIFVGFEKGNLLLYRWKPSKAMRPVYDILQRIFPGESEVPVEKRNASKSATHVATLDELLAQRAVRRRTQRWAKPHALCAELLWVVRPLAGLAAMRVWGTRSWRAWSVPVLLDVISR